MPSSSSSSLPKLRSLVLARVPDIFVLGLLIAAIFLVDKLIPIWQRPFRLDDPDISYEHATNDIVPIINVVYGSLLFPPVFVSFWCLLWHLLLKRTSSSSSVSELIGRPASKGPKWHSVAFLIGHTLTVATTLLITEATKRQVGRLRPDFLNRCNPVLPANGTITAGRNPLITTIYYNQTICTGDAAEIREGRLSFPSGHSSGAFCGLGFLAFWLFSILRPLPFLVMKNQHMPLSTGHGIRMTLSLTPLLMATFIAVSRLQQNVHNPTDVLGGSIIGIVVALFFWYLYIESELAYANKLERKLQRLKKFAEEEEDTQHITAGETGDEARGLMRIPTSSSRSTNQIIPSPDPARGRSVHLEVQREASNQGTQHHHHDNRFIP